MDPHLKENQFFFVPGPTALPNRVIEAGATPMVSHRSQEFKQICGRAAANAQQLFQTAQQVLLLTSSGTGGLEAAVLNFLHPGDRVIVASAGQFGRRSRDIATAYQLDLDYIEFPWGEAVDPAVIGAKLAADTAHQIKAVIVQHHETSTGVLNPLEAISAARGDHPALLLVDAVSGLAACPLQMDAWGLDVVVTSSQKALMTPPGLALVAVSERAWQAYAENKNPKFYFDLGKARKSAAGNETPFTPAVSLIYALDEALQMLLETGGIAAAVARHNRRRDAARAAIKALGLRPVCADAVAGGALTAFYLPEGIAPKQVKDIMGNKYQAAIAGGMGDLKPTTLRLAHLGYMKDLDLLAGIGALEMALKESGFAVQLGAGLTACAEALYRQHQS